MSVKGMKYIRPHIERMFMTTGRTSVEATVDYPIDHVDPRVIESIQREALRDVVRAGFRDFGKTTAQDGVPGVLNVGGGDYTRLPFASIEERLAVIASYDRRSKENQAVRDALARDTLELFAAVPGIEAMVEAAKNGIIP